MVESSSDFAAIIAAGGSGSRFSSSTTEEKPKQFLNLHGMPLYSWPLRAFAKHRHLKGIVITAPSQMVQLTEVELVSIRAKLKINLEVAVIAGGNTRQASVFNGLKFLRESGSTPEFIMVHDAARPFLDFETVDLVLRSAIEYGACTVGAPVSDTIKRVDGSKVVQTLNRAELVAVQTPQAAHFSHLLDAHSKALEANFSATDDVALLEWAGHEVHVVPGPTHNIKLTHRTDLIMAEALADYLFPDLL